MTAISSPADQHRQRALINAFKARPLADIIETARGFADTDQPVQFAAQRQLVAEYRPEDLPAYDQALRNR